MCIYSEKGRVVCKCSDQALLYENALIKACYVYIL